MLLDTTHFAAYDLPLVHFSPRKRVKVLEEILDSDVPTTSRGEKNWIPKVSVLIVTFPLPSEISCMGVGIVDPARLDARLLIAPWIEICLRSFSAVFP